VVTFSRNTSVSVVQGLDFVVDGGVRVAEPSTVVDMTKMPPKVLRQGKVVSCQFACSNLLIDELLILLWTSEECDATLFYYGAILNTFCVLNMRKYFSIH